MSLLNRAVAHLIAFGIALVSGAASADITLPGGTILSVPNANFLSPGPITFAGNAELRFTGSFTLNNPIVFNSGVTGTLNTNGQNDTVSGILSGAGRFSKIGAGTLTLTGNNTYSGGTTLAAGTLALASNSALGSGLLTFSGGTLLGIADVTPANALSMSGAITFAAASGKTFTAGGNQWSLGANTTLTFGSQTANGTVVWRTVSASITNPGTQRAIVAGGTLKGGDAAFSFLFNSLASFEVAADATLDLAGFNVTMPANLSGSGMITSTGGPATMTTRGGGYDGIITGAVGLIVSSGNLTLRGSNSYGGGTVISGGQTLTFDGNFASFLPGVISGAGALVKQGTDSLTLAGNNTFSGGTTLLSGQLGVSSSSALGTGSLTFGGGTLAGVADVALANRVIMSGNLEITALSGTTLDLNNGSGWSLASDTTITFGRENEPGTNGTVVWRTPGGSSVSFPGTQRVRVANGTLKGGDNSFGFLFSNLAALEVGTNGTLDLGGFSVTAPADFSGSGRVTSSTGTPIFSTRGGSFNGGLDGSLGLTLTAGNLSLNGVVNYSGATTIASGATLTLGNGGTIGNVSNGGQLVFAGAVANVGTVSQVASGSVVRVRNGSLNLAGSGITTDNLVLGDQAGSSASLVLSTGKTLAIVSETIGNGSFTQSGGTHTATSLVLGATVGSLGVFNLNGGSFAVGSVALGLGDGTFNFNGGTFNNAGDLRVTHFNIGVGASYAGSTINVTGSLANLGSLSARGQINVGGSLDNSGALELAGNSLTGGGALFNNNLLSGFGTIGGTGGFINYGQVQTAGGGLVLSNTGANANYGNWDVASGQPLALSGATLTNFGVMNLNGGLISGGGTLNNGGGGLIAGRGTISANFSNAGELGLTGGALAITRAFTNSGLIDLRGVNASLTGGAVGNTGIVQGAGTISSAFANSGTVEALGGTLLLGGAVTNGATGLMTAGTGNRLVISSGLASNAGIIQLAGGTFDNNAHALSNTGQVSGYGTFRASAFTNLGRMNFGGGNTVVNGNLTNQAGATLDISYNPATFTGNVVNNGFIKTTATNVTWAGSFTNNGTYLSDPSTQVFQDITLGTGGALQGGVGDVFIVTGNMFNNSQANTLFDLSQARLSFSSGAHSLVWSASNLGTSRAGYQSNFAIGIFELASGGSLSLTGTGALPAANALYVHSLVLGGGLAQVGAIQSGLNIYYDPLETTNAYLGGATYDLAGGGHLLAVAAVPEPETYAMWLAGLLLMGGIAHRRRVARRRQGA